MSVTNKYRFLVHYTSWKNGGSELNYSKILQCDGKYPTLVDLQMWEEYCKETHGDEYRIDILSFSRMTKTERT